MSKFTDDLKGPLMSAAGAALFAAGTPYADGAMKPDERTAFLADAVHLDPVATGLTALGVHLAANVGRRIYTARKAHMQDAATKARR
jgi:hypothetical protein